MFDDFGRIYLDFAKRLGDWVKQGKVKYREEFIESLKSASAAFAGLLNGAAFGKREIKLIA